MSDGLEQTRGGRIVVGEDLSVPGRPEVFVVTKPPFVETDVRQS